MEGKLSAKVVIMARFLIHYFCLPLRCFKAVGI